MFGTVAKFRIKAGKEDGLLHLGEDWPRIDGLVQTYIFRADNEPNVYYMATVFDSRESYRASLASTPIWSNEKWAAALLPSEFRASVNW